MMYTTSQVAAEQDTCDFFSGCFNHAGHSFILWLGKVFDYCSVLNSEPSILGALASPNPSSHADAKTITDILLGTMIMCRCCVKTSRFASQAHLTSPSLTT